MHTINSGEIHKQFVGRMFRPFWIYEDVSLKRIKEVNDKIEVFTADIKNSSLSPFEKVMAIYMGTTQFIESYKGNSADIHDVDSSVMHILSDGDDGYKIQCAGYTDLFCRMAYECGIHTKELEISFMKNHDKKDSSAHSVAIVDLDDEKYGIHGSFICDVRGESDSQESYKQLNNIDNYNAFVHFCLSFKDFDAMNNMFSSNGSKKRRYAINNFEITGEEDKYISNERIKSDDISLALNNLYKFIFENDGKSSILKEHDFDGICELNATRSMIDLKKANKARVSDNSSLTLEESIAELIMMISKKETDTSKSIDSNSNNRK